MVVRQRERRVGRGRQKGKGGSGKEGVPFLVRVVAMHLGQRVMRKIGGRE